LAAVGKTAEIHGQDLLFGVGLNPLVHPSLPVEQRLPARLGEAEASISSSANAATEVPGGIVASVVTRENLVVGGLDVK